MKTLYLIRHAKSDWSNYLLDDYDRPLNKRGKKDAPYMGKILKLRNIYPDKFITSGAKRAKKTAFKIAKVLKYEKNKIEINDELYHSSTNDLIKIIKEMPNEINTLFCVSHNPALNLLSSFLVNFEENIPTCAVVEINFDIKDWNKISNDNAKLKSFDYPKKIYSFN